jgi:nucleosome binding factor SPN SPT16 subunit
MSVLGCEQHRTLLKAGLDAEHSDIIIQEFDKVKLISNHLLQIVEKEKENTNDNVYKAALDREYKSLIDRINDD